MSARVILLGNTEIADRKNTVFAGTIVTKGQGRTIVANTGFKTELGRALSVLLLFKNL